MLKIKPEHYAHIKNTIKEKVNLPDLHEEIKADGRYKDFETRFRHDCLYKAGLSSWICDNLYPYMDDTHINSALKAIIRELS